MESTREIRGVMIPVSGGSVLLPNATVAEVISYVAPAAVDGAPPWLLGTITWRGWHLPLVSFPVLVGIADSEASESARIAVLKALGGDSRLQFIAMLVQGFPRLTTVTPDLLIPTGDAGGRAAGVHSEVLVREDRAYIPDLGAIEDMVLAALPA